MVIVTYNDIKHQKQVCVLLKMNSLDSDLQWNPDILPTIPDISRHFPTFPDCRGKSGEVGATSWGLPKNFFKSRDLNEKRTSQGYTFNLLNETFSNLEWNKGDQQKKLMVDQFIIHQYHMSGD